MDIDGSLAVKILGLAGSPRRNGTSENLLDAFLAGAGQGGAATEKFILAELNINACNGCEDCLIDGDCPFRDDASELYERLLQADVVVLAAPVYFYSVPAQVKLLIDRCQALWARKYVLRRGPTPDPGRGVIIAVAASKGPKVFDGFLLTVKYFMDTFDKKINGFLLRRSSNAKGRGDIHESLMNKAFKLGLGYAQDRDYGYQEEDHG